MTTKLKTVDEYRDMDAPAVRKELSTATLEQLETLHQMAYDLAWEECPTYTTSYDEILYLLEDILDAKDSAKLEARITKEEARLAKLKAQLAPASKEQS